MELHTGLCPKCREKLEIPAHLTEFSCMYCGTRLSPANLNNDICNDDGSAFAFYKANILSVITDHRQIDKSLNKNAYAPAIDAYEADCREVFEKLDVALRAGSLTAEDASNYLLDVLAQDWATKKHGRNSLMDGDKFRIAIFTVPMIRRLGLASMEEFCTALHKNWMERYPKHPWAIGDFDVINSSFRKKILGFCFITTAVCLEEGRSDDCAELTAFRAFRDGWLQTCPDGPALVEEYYRIAPWIVLEIEKKPDAKERYATIRKEYLAPCYEALQAGRPEVCKERYTKMVRALEKEYLS